MPTVELTAENFQDVVASNDTVLVDFWASWCGPCRSFAPVYEAAADRHGDVVFAKVDTEAQPELAGAFRIMSIPTVMAFRAGVGVFSQPGALPAPVLDDLVEQLRALDRDEVRRAAAEAATAASPST